MFGKMNKFLQRCFQLMEKRYFCHGSNNKALLKHIQAKIKFSGPITIHEYMKEVLTNPVFGYYMRNDVVGERGDFITSPEVSQLFGELLGIWIYNEWQKMGAPKPFQLIELGPGTGSLMKDVLQILNKLQIGNADFKIHMVEKSLTMSSVQERILCTPALGEIVTIPDNLASTYKSSHTTEGVPIDWHYHLSDIPPGFSMVISNEFFDALPVHKLKKTEDGWRELLIDINPDSTTEEELRYVISRGPTPASQLFVDLEEKREDLEVCPDAGVLLKQLIVRITENGGAVLIIDYGHNGTLGDTFRAFSNHTQVSPLSFPGHSDLTCDVDFSYLKKQVQHDAVVYGPVHQGFFLKNMGIELRLAKLLQSCDKSQREHLISGYQMLVEPKKMGERYKVITFFPLVMKEILQKYPPPGFFRSFENQ